MNFTQLLNVFLIDGCNSAKGFVKFYQDGAHSKLGETVRKGSRGIDAKTKDAIEKVLDGQYCQPKKLHIKLQAKLQNEKVPSFNILIACCLKIQDFFISNS